MKNSAGCFVIAMMLSTMAVASQGSITVKLPDGRDIDICQRSGKILAFAKASEGSASLQVDRELADIVVRSEDSFFLKGSVVSSNKRDHSAILVSRLPSVSGEPEGFCGAGHEDYLILVGISDRSIIFHDKVIVQSCLKSISLVSDEGDDPRKAIDFLGPDGVVRFSQSLPPDFKPIEKKLVITNDKFEGSKKSP